MTSQSRKSCAPSFLSLTMINVLLNSSQCFYLLLDVLRYYVNTCEYLWLSAFSTNKFNNRSLSSWKILVMLSYSGEWNNLSKCGKIWKYHKQNFTCFYHVTQEKKISCLYFDHLVDQHILTVSILETVLGLDSDDSALLSQSPFRK